MNLLEIRAAIAAAEAKDTVERGHSVLVYGPPKSGKSGLAATAAKSPHIDRVFYFDNENSWEVMLWMLESGKLTEEEAAKIHVININDTTKDPYAIETMIRALNSIKNPVYIRYSDGKLLPSKPAKMDEDILEFQMSKLTMRDVVITDSLSQLSDSAMAALMLTRTTVKPEWDDYSAQGKQLSDMLSVIQQARYTNFICVTHHILQEDQDGADKFFPMCGTKAFCHKVSKYFGTVIYTGVKVGKHVAGSSSTYSKTALTGSRRGLKIENSKDWSIAALFDAFKIDTSTEEEAKPAPSLGAKRGILSKKLGG